MDANLPTTLQAQVLLALEAAPGAEVPAAWRADLEAAGWLADGEVTERGLSAALDRRDLDAYRAADPSERAGIRLYRHSDTGGLGLLCDRCRVAQKVSGGGFMDGPGWFTDEEGRLRDRQGELAAARHFARHDGKDLPLLNQAA